MMKRILIFLFFMIACGFVHSQVTVKGLIMDSKSKKGVGFAHVYKEGTNIGCICDYEGNFILKHLKTIPDSLTVSCVGYESRKMYKSSLEAGKKIVVELKSKLFGINEVTVKGEKSKTELLGSDVRKSLTSSPLYFASQNMRFFKSKRYPAYIESFSFFITEIEGDKKARIRVYDVDSLEQIPQNDMLNANVIANNLTKGWNTIDLSEYKLLVPQEGFFIGLESVVIDEDCWEKLGEDRYVTKFRDFGIGCVEEKTITARKYLRIGDYEKYGERKISGYSNDWRLDDPNRGFDLLYRVKIEY